MTIVGVFAIGWGQWGASGLPKGAAVPVRILVVVLGLMVIARANRLRRNAIDDRRSTFPSRGYATIVGAELVALVAGAVILGQAGGKAYVAPWIAFVVGVHFLVFVRLFAWRYNLAGAGLILAAVAGAVLAAASGRRPAEAVTGLLAAAVLLVTGARRLMPPRRSSPVPRPAPAPDAGRSLRRRRRAG